MDRVRYGGVFWDSARWDALELRPGDIIVATPAKSGTTWTQMICVLLIFQDPELPRPLGVISPWIDMVTRPRTEVVADLAAQRHRRVLKTHTPLDGLPLDPRVTYLCVGRDPRDVALSMDRHVANLNVDQMLRLRAEAAAIDGIELPALRPRPPPLPDARQRFWRWVDDDTDPADSTSSLRSTLHQLTTFWTASGGLDVVLLHYDDLLADLEGQMRILAEHLGIAVPEARWPTLVEAATLDGMRQRTALAAPGATRGQWRDAGQFFAKGTSGQWRDLLTADDLDRYAARARSLAPPDLVTWVHRGPLD
jgi:hypothetical protein